MTILFGTPDAGLQLRAIEANAHRLKTIIRETAQVENLCDEGMNTKRGAARAQEPALLASAGRMPKRSQHRVSEGQDARSERPAMGMGSPEPDANREHPQVDNLCYEGTHTG